MSVDYARNTSKIVQFKVARSERSEKSIFLLHFDGSTFCLRKEELRICSLSMNRLPAPSLDHNATFVRWQNACLFSCENVRQHPSIPRFDVSRRKIQPNIDRGRKSQIPFVPSRLKVLECESIKVISYRGRINNGIFLRHVSRSPL